MSGFHLSRIAHRLVAVAAGALLAFGALTLAGCESNYPEGGDTDAFEIRSVTMSGKNYEVLTYDDELFVLSPDAVTIYELADSGREFMSRNEDTLWIKGETADRLGLEGLEVLGEAPASEE